MTHRPNNFATRQSTRGGFTLIEVVIAMGMVGIMALSLFASLTIASKATRRAEADIEPSRTMALTMNLLGQDFQSATAPNITATLPLAGSFEAVQSQDDRGHEGDDVLFFSTAESPQHVDANGDIRQIELTVATEATTGDHVLVRRVTRNLLSDLTPPPDEEILCRGVSSFTLMYFDGVNWANLWDSTQEDNTLPTAVQVILELERKDAAGQTTITKYTRVFNLSCSTAVQDANVGGGNGI